MSEEVLRLNHFSCQIGQAQYFTDLSFSLEAGETHSLVGLSVEQRGVLVSYFSGQRMPCTGSLFLFGNAAHDVGEQIFCLRKQSSLISRMTVTENLLVLTPRPRPSPFIRFRSLAVSCQELLDQYGLQIDASTLVSELSAFGQTAVELLKAVAYGARIVFYDRELEALTEREFTQLKNLLLSLNAEGIAVVLLCGLPARMLAISHRITVVKDGSLVKCFLSPEIGIQDIHRAALGMAGMAPVASRPARRQAGSQHPLLSLKGMRLQKDDMPIDLTVWPGEIICIVDYVSSRADRVLEALYGLRSCSCYHFSVNGQVVPTNSVRQSFQRGMLLVERMESPESLLSEATVRSNIALPLLCKSSLTGGIIRRQFLAAELQAAAEAVGLSSEQLGQSMTADLIFKTQLARILMSYCPILLLQNPFAGLVPADIQTLRNFLIDYAQRGNCVIFSSTHFSEISEFCSKCYYLMKDGLSEQDHV